VGRVGADIYFLSPPERLIKVIRKKMIRTFPIFIGAALAAKIPEQVSKQQEAERFFEILCLCSRHGVISS
jgi:hypothetical protein